MGRTPGDGAAKLTPMMPDRTARSRAPWLVAATVLAVALISTAAYAVTSSPDRDADVGRIQVTSEPGDDADGNDDEGNNGQNGAVPVDPFPDDPCKGPPPFAGQNPGPPDSGQDGDRAAQRQQESDEFEAFKADNCVDPDGDDENDTGGPPADLEVPAGNPGLPPGVPPTPSPDTGDDGVPVDPFPEDPCLGPPPFAGQLPTSPADRAAESEAFEQWKAENCVEDSTTGSPPAGPFGPGGG